MSSLLSHRRALSWFLPASITIVGACSGAGDSGDGATGGAGSRSTTGGTVSGTTGNGGTGSVGSNTSGSMSSTVTGAGGATGSGGSVGSGGSTGVGGSTSVDAGGTATDGGHFGDTVCGAGVTPVGIGRCATSKYVIAKGTALTIANFEDPGPKADHNTIFYGDGRAGNFIDLHASTTGAVITMKTEHVPGPRGSDSWILHYSGKGTGGASPMFSVPVADCYDSRAYKGVSFWIKGNPAAGNDHLKFQVHTPVAQPAPSGGCTAADDAAGRCNDHFAAYVEIKSTWTRYNIHWTDLKQNCRSNIDPNYNPAQYNEMFSFVIPKSNAGFDVSLDEFTFDPGDVTTNGLTDIVKEATFNEMWTLANPDGTVTQLRNPFYTYQGMLTAASGFAGFATTGDARTKRLEAAAFFSNVAHETDSLGIIEEKGCATDHTCTQYGTAPNGLTYHGRGPIQLTLGVNYSQANTGLGLSGTQNIANNPELVATDAAISWKTAFWFWMSGTSGGGTTPHQAITGGQGLGATIRIINGIECGGANAPAVADRIRHFKRFSYMFGLDPGDANNGC